MMNMNKEIKTEVKNFITNNKEVLNQFAIYLRDKEWLNNTLLPSKKLKFRYLKAREKIPVTKHDIKLAIEYLHKIDC